MATQLPQRPRAHQLEDESENFFRGALPPGWTCDKPQHDYGVDLRVGLAANGQINGKQLIVQIKASEAEANPNSVAIQLEVQTLILLREMLEVAMLVKYIAHEREAYWLLLKDFIAQPRVGQKTITVRIPKANRLSECPWEQVAEHVQVVHYRKLNANRSGYPQH